MRHAVYGLPPVDLAEVPGDAVQLSPLIPGTALLLANLPAMKGRGADLGCGLGILSRVILGSPAVTALTLVEVDRRAVDMAHRNVADPRATIVWADIRAGGTVPGSLDFVV